MHDFINNLKQHYKSIMILRNNPELLRRYALAPMSLYTLSTNQSTNKKVQEDYNQLHPDYKYHHILGKDTIPLSILLADPQYIKLLTVFNMRIFIESKNSGKTL